MTVHPSDHISQEVDKFPDISITSGAIQYGVPTMLLLYVVSSDKVVATPKSANLTVLYYLMIKITHL